MPTNPTDDVIEAIAVGVFKAEARRQHDVAGLLRRCDEALRSARADTRRLDWMLERGATTMIVERVWINRDQVDAAIAAEEG